MSRYTTEEREQSLERLREWLKPGDTVRTILRHTSRSGMSHSISLLASVGPDILDIDYHAARALGESIDQKHGGIRIGGCGMSFHLVYSLSHALFPEGFGCIGERCPSNDHRNGDRDYTRHADGEPSQQDNPLPDIGPKHWHRDGGYALRHRWL